MNGVLKVEPYRLKGEVMVPPSKSDTHRALIAAAIADGGEIFNASACDDTKATLDGLKGLGARFSAGDGVIRCLSGLVRGGNAEIDCRESGSTLRFLLPIAAALGGNYRFTGSEGLLKRPIDGLIDALRCDGLEVCAKQSGAINLSGSLSSQEIRVDASISSQYVTGLLFALPLLGEGAKIIATGDSVSRPYVAMTKAMLERFGVKIVENGGVYTAVGAQKAAAIKVEGDWSAAVNWLCLMATGQDIILRGLNPDSLQADKGALSVLKAMGATPVWREDGALAIKAAPLSGGTVDVSDMPDATMALAVTGCYARNGLSIVGAGRLRGKESDRLAATAQMICGLGGHATITDDGLLIKSAPLKGGTINAHGDHRIAMAAAIAAVLSGQAVTIHGADSVTKSYPSFWDDFSSCQVTLA